MIQCSCSCRRNCNRHDQIRPALTKRMTEMLNRRRKLDKLTLLNLRSHFFMHPLGNLQLFWQKIGKMWSNLISVCALNALLLSPCFLFVAMIFPPGVNDEVIWAKIPRENIEKPYMSMSSKTQAAFMFVYILWAEFFLLSMLYTRLPRILFV